MLACTIHCRHLMVWKIFAPRFIYEGITSYLSFGAIIIGYLILVRVHSSVERLMLRIALNKPLLEQQSEVKRSNNGHHINETLTKRLANGIEKHRERIERIKLE